MSYRNPVHIDDDDAIEKYEAELAKREKDQETMTRINKVIAGLIKTPRRSKNSPKPSYSQEYSARKERESHYQEHVAELVRLAGITEVQAINFLTPDFMGRIGFASYMLTNNNANIKRIKERIEDIKARNEKIATVIESGNADVVMFGVTIRKDINDNRLRLFFPDKPDETTRKDLRTRGFLWSPSAGAWQRQITNTAEYQAEFAIKAYAARNNITE